ncbi:aldo/keto reductase [Seiridium cupressi]
MAAQKASWLTAAIPKPFRNFDYGEFVDIDDRQRAEAMKNQAVAKEIRKQLTQVPLKDVSTHENNRIFIFHPHFSITLRDKSARSSKMAAEKWVSTSTVPLKDSEGKMPVIGFGVYQIDRPDTADACLRAIAAGYRHIDTAQLYQNEAEVGEALKKCNLPREDIFVTTKIRYPRLGKGKTYLRALQSVQKIDPREDGYVDLFLIHTPYGINAKDRKEMWLALEKLHEEGKAKAIGVSNFASEHLEEMRGAVSAHRIKLHPWTQQRKTVEYCNEHGIILEAFSPLARGRRWDDPVVTEIAEKHAKSPAQILIRYCLQKGWVPLPKSEKDERMKENLDVFGFDISEEEVVSLDALDGQKEPI